MQTPNTFRGGPDARGHFGIYGGRYVAETLMPLILAVEAAYTAARADPTFQAELDYYLEHYVGRPSPLYFAERLTRHFGGAKLYFKRDELNHTGAHKINNVLGQILLARRMKKRQEDLPQHVVDLVRAGVVELVAFEIELGAAKMPGEPLGEI